MASYLFTSESVTEGHPDKICDQISDAVLDAVFAVDTSGRAAFETAISTGLILVMGQITTSGCVDIPKIARQVVLDAGYGHMGREELNVAWEKTDRIDALKTVLQQA